MLVSRARIVVGTGHPLLFHFSYHYYSPGCSHPGSSMRDIATLSAPQNPQGVDGQILTPWKLSHARRARHVPMPIGHSFAGLPPHSRRHNPQKWLVPLYRMTTCACGSGQHSPSPWPSCATQMQWRLLPCARTRLCTRGGRHAAAHHNAVCRLVQCQPSIDRHPPACAGTPAAEQGHAQQCSLPCNAQPAAAWARARMPVPTPLPLLLPLLLPHPSCSCL